MDEVTANLLDWIDSHGSRLHAMLAKLTASRDAADELLQDLFLRILRTSGFAAAPSPEAYLFRAAINLAFDWRKRRGRTHNFALLYGDVAAEDSAPLDRLVQSETVECVLAAMEQLSEFDRELITLRFLQGESPEWIAERWKMPAHSIRSRCSKAVARLRTLVVKDTSLQNSRRHEDD